MEQFRSLLFKNDQQTIQQNKNDLLYKLKEVIEKHHQLLILVFILIGIIFVLIMIMYIMIFTYTKIVGMTIGAMQPRGKHFVFFSETHHIFLLFTFRYRCWERKCSKRARIISSFSLHIVCYQVLKAIRTIPFFLSTTLKV